MKKAYGIGFVCVVLLVGIGLYFYPKMDPPNLPTGDLEFRSAGPIAIAVGKVVGKDRVLTAEHILEGKHWVCVLVDGTGRFAELDAGYNIEDALMLVKQKFKSPSKPISKTMSIYRSLTKSEIEYEQEKGDRIVVLMCPKVEWKTLELHCDALFGDW